MSVNLILGIVAILGVGYVAAEAVYQYRTTPGTALLTAFSNSLTVAVTRLSAAVVAAWDGVARLADYFNEPQIADALRTVVPDSAKPYAVIGILFLAEYARRRTLAKPGD